MDRTITQYIHSHRTFTTDSSYNVKQVSKAHAGRSQWAVSGLNYVASTTIEHLDLLTNIVITLPIPALILKSKELREQDEN